MGLKLHCAISDDEGHHDYEEYKHMDAALFQHGELPINCSRA
jgi:hypothetical protein